MYAVIEKNRLEISVTEFYNMAWYDKDQFPSRSEKYEFEYGNLEVDVHKNGRKYLTGFVIDPRKFIVDYIRVRYQKSFTIPKSVRSVSIDTGTHTQLFCVDFLRGRSFVIDGMEKDLIFPQFCRRKGEINIQGLEVLDVLSLIKYLVDRFNYRETTFVRQGDTAYDFQRKRRWKIRLGEKRKGTIAKKETAC